jgi:hypothetical protein
MGVLTRVTKRRSVVKRIGHRIAASWRAGAPTAQPRSWFLSSYQRSMGLRHRFTAAADARPHASRRDPTIHSVTQAEAEA